MDTDLPLVSCIMPTTRGRVAFAQRAIELFLAQDYPRKHLVIAGEDEIDEDLYIPAMNPKEALNARIRYFECPKGLSIGAKRNLACEASAGELIAHWDDDDWHSPQRLSAQISLLKAEGSRLCGADRIVFYDANDRRAWLFKSVRNPWLAGGTLVYERSLWNEHRFSAVSDGEDTAFIDETVKAGAKVSVLRQPSYYVGVLHLSNTTTRNINHQWSHYDAEVVRGWMGETFSRGIHGRA